MISGINSAGLSLALRAASNSRATMDKMTTQIATGKKVASVKDDGAAYVRAAAMKSQQVEIEARTMLTSMYKVASEEQTAGEEAIVDLYNQIKGKILSAKSYAAGSAARASLQREFEALIAQVDMPFSTNSNLSTSYGNWGAQGWGIQPNGGDAILAQNAIWYLPTIGGAWSTYATNGVQFKLNDMTNASDAYLDNMLASANTVQSFYTLSYSNWASNDKNWIDQINRNDERKNANLETAISSLTDADLGDASKSKAISETKQQLAFTAISNALSHYGKVAGGLLGNVQSTQRGVMA